LKLTRDKFIELLKMGKQRKDIMQDYGIDYDELHKLTKYWNLVGWRPNKGEPPAQKKSKGQMAQLNTVNFMQALEETTEVEELNIVDEQIPNVIERPPHYTAGKVECIDAIESAIEGLDPEEAVHVGNVMKYIWRFKKKNGLQDLEKAQWYLGRLIRKLKSR
jgi:hypothetical protein